MRTTTDSKPRTVEITGRHNDADIVGDLADCADVLDRPITLAAGANRFAAEWHNSTQTVGEWCDTLSTFEVGAKDGNAILQGELKDKKRGNVEVVRNHVLLIDIDVGTTPDEIVKIAVERGLFALIWTTHSNLTTTSTIGASGALELLKKTGTAPPIFGVFGALLNPKVGLPAIKSIFAGNAKRYLPRVVDSITDATDHVITVRDKTSLEWKVKHAPLPKCRVMFVLSKPFEFIADGVDQLDAIDGWKRMYAGLATELSLPFDRSCIDPARLMYSPRVAEQRASDRIIIVAGKALDTDTIARVDYRPQSRWQSHGVGGGGSFEPRRDPSNPFLAAVPRKMGTTETKFLARFVALFNKRFMARDFVEFYSNPHDVTTVSKDALKSACPLEALHSKPDKTPPFFVANANGTRGFAMKCHHSSCMSVTEGDRLRYLDELCRAYGIEDAHALLPFVSPPATPDELEKLDRTFKPLL